MKNILMLFLFLFVVTFELSAQHNRIALGFNGGLSLSTLKSPVFEGEHFFNPGFQAAISGRLYFLPRWFASTSIGYQQNGFKAEDEPPSFGLFSLATENLTSTLKTHYLSNSYVTGFEFGKRFKFDVHAGFYWSYFLHMQHSHNFLDAIDPSTAQIIIDFIGEEAYQDILEGINLRDEYFNKFDIGFTAGFSASYQLNLLYRVTFLSSFNQGLVPVMNDRQTSAFVEVVDSYNRWYSARIGVMRFF